MIKCLFLVMFCCLAGVGFGQSVDSLTIKNIDGGNVSLLPYQGKKVLFIIAPVRVSDSLKVSEIAAFNARYGDTVKLVGIMSKEDGYADSNKTRIKSMYQNKGVSILLTEGMNTRKGANQSGLMQFFTNASLNNRFDDDVSGLGQKFFVNENGHLYSVLVPQTPLFSPATKRNIERHL